MVIYSNTEQYAEHVALIKGDIDPDTPINVRVHQLDVLSDVLADADHPHAKQRSMEIIAREGGILLLMREDYPTALSDRVKATMTGEEVREEKTDVLRDYGIGAQILLDLGVRDMVLLTSSDRSIVGLEGYGLKVVGTRDIR